jgi:hypothetical protein
MYVVANYSYVTSLDTAMIRDELIKGVLDPKNVVVPIISPELSIPLVD